MEKIIYLVRHGQAYDGSLTSKGIQQLIDTAKKLQEELGGLEGVVIYHSPILRAAQSAKVMAREMGEIPIISREELKCNTYNVGAVVNEVQGKAIIISHEPDLEYYMEKLGKYVTFKNGQAIKL
ncbi:MAG: phosphoglycerate mutase family protein [Nanoarchaeota archaeon]